MLPGAHGLDVLKQVRRECEVPVLVLSRAQRHGRQGARARAGRRRLPDEAVLARGAAGARARAAAPARAAARRARSTVGDARDRPRRPAACASAARPVELTRVEFDLLAALARRPGAAITRARGSSRTCSTPSATAPSARSTCTSRGCARSSGPRAPPSRPSGASATAWTRPRDAAPAPAADDRGHGGAARRARRVAARRGQPARLAAGPARRGGRARRAVGPGARARRSRTTRPGPRSAAGRRAPRRPPGGARGGRERAPLGRAAPARRPVARGDAALRVRRRVPRGRPGGAAVPGRAADGARERRRRR